jgi:hypothetical protein
MAKGLQTKQVLRRFFLALVSDFLLVLERMVKGNFICNHNKHAWQANFQYYDGFDHVLIQRLESAMVCKYCLTDVSGSKKEEV